MKRSLVYLAVLAAMPYVARDRCTFCLLAGHVAASCPSLRKFQRSCG